MGRPPCCDKAGIKKGPWTPEEDIILVSYIQEHGPGNWRSVPTNTGLLRCSKSCRLRWTNYLRPGIKRGNFTSHEEGMIIHLQALLGNKWAAIASYLPQRTDNDIKNYWNTHLKKKLKKFQSSIDPRCMAQDSDQFAASNIDIVERSRSLDSFTSQANNSSSASAAPATGRLNQGATYASSAENISRLLEGWMRSSPKCNNADANSVPAPPLQATVGHNKPKAEGGQGFCDPLISNEELESILSFENVNSISWDKGDSTSKVGDPKEVIVPAAVSKQTSEISSTSNNINNNNPPLTFLEKWLLDESSTGQVEEMSQMMELSSIF